MGESCSLRPIFVRSEAVNISWTVFTLNEKPFFFSFYNRGGFHRDPRQIIQYKDLDAPDDAEAFWTAWYDQLLCLTYNISTVKPEANQTNIQPRNADTCSCIYFYLLSFSL